MKRKVEFAAHGRDRSGLVGHVLHECLLSDGRDAVFEMSLPAGNCTTFILSGPTGGCAGLSNNLRPSHSGIGHDLTRTAFGPKHPRRLASETEILALCPELGQTK